MANLKPLHAAAISRLAAYTPPPTSYYSLPVSRRAAVLILLYADRRGELRVVLTMRAKTLSSYAGQAALPGGKADTLLETPVQTARREAFEEIGLPLDDSSFPPPFRIHHLCQLPASFARTELAVRPCVAWIEADPSLMKDPPVRDSKSTGTSTSSGQRRVTRSMSAWPQIPTVEDALIPRLDPKEVAAVFTAPFESFLSTSAPLPDQFMKAAASTTDVSSIVTPTPSNSGSSINADEWYSGQWLEWHDTRWRLHNFYVSSHDQRVAWASQPPTTMTMNRFRVFGMTARILIDAARIAFNRNPQFEFNEHMGDEAIIKHLLDEGKLPDRPSRRRGQVVATQRKHDEDGQTEQEHQDVAKM